MSQPLVLDASALIAVAKNEPGAQFVINAMLAGTGNNFVHAINACEVAYILTGHGLSEKDAWEATSFGGFIRIEDVGQSMLENVCRLKSNTQHLSLGDCFAIALAEDLAGTVLTSDRNFAKAGTGAKITLIR